MKSDVHWQQRVRTNVGREVTFVAKLQDPIRLRLSTYDQGLLVTIQDRNLISHSDHHSSAHAISGSKVPCFKQLNTASRAMSPAASSMSLVSERQTMGPALARNGRLALPLLRP